MQADAFRGHGLSLLDEQARLRGLQLMLFPLESPPFTPINRKFIMCKTDNYDRLQCLNVGADIRLILLHVLYIIDLLDSPFRYSRKMSTVQAAIEIKDSCLSIHDI